MDKRYQVFVSSTFEDLKEERAKVITALLNIDCIPCGMEYFPAANEDAWQSIERLIPNCDYYVVIIAGKYGSMPPKKQKSYTHMEYELAIKHSVPVLALLHKDVGTLPSSKTEIDPERRKKLQQFRQLASKRLCRFWSSPDQITGEFLASLKHQIDRHPRTGWVRGDAVANDEAKTEIIKLRRLLEEHRSEIESLKVKNAGAIENLAFGEDLLKFRGGFGGIFRLNKLRTIEFEVITTWDNVIRHIRLSHPDWWTSDKLERSLSDALDPIAKSIPKVNALRSAFSEEVPRIDPEDIEKITFQLSSLELISRSREHWQFNQKGLIYSGRLLALRKGEDYIAKADNFRIKPIAPFEI